MKDDDNQAPWQSLVKAAQEAGAGEPPEREENAPEGFVARMRLLRKTLWTFAKSYLWRRWSLFAVIVALVLYLIAYLLLKADPPPSITPPQLPSPLSP